MYLDEDMFHIEETPEAACKAILSKQDIKEILSWQGSEHDAMEALNITPSQYRYVREHFNPKTLALDYRKNMNVLSYD